MGLDDGCVLQVELHREPDISASELVELTGRLRHTLLELDVDAVDLARGGVVPAGAKPVEPLSMGALVIALGSVGLRAVVQLVNTWLEHRPIRAVTMTIDGDSIELAHSSRADRRRLVDAFIERHTQD